MKFPHVIPFFVAPFMVFMVSLFCKLSDANTTAATSTSDKITDASSPVDVSTAGTTPKKPSTTAPSVETLRVDMAKTSPYSLFLSWHSNSTDRTYELQYCNATGCDMVPNLSGPNHLLRGLSPFTSYNATLTVKDSVNVGNSSIETSTAPLPPSSYGVFPKFNETNGEVALHFNDPEEIPDELCFAILQQNDTLNCSRKTDSNCTMPVSIQIKNSSRYIVIVGYGRGLCSFPSYVFLKENRRPKLMMMSLMGVAPVALFAIFATVATVIAATVSIRKKREFPLPATDEQKTAVSAGNDAPAKKTDEIPSGAGRMVDDDGLIYVDVSNECTHPPDAEPIRTDEPTVYAMIEIQATMDAAKTVDANGDANGRGPVGAGGDGGETMYVNYEAADSPTSAALEAGDRPTSAALGASDRPKSAALKAHDGRTSAALEADDGPTSDTLEAGMEINEVTIETEGK